MSWISNNKLKLNYNKTVIKTVQREHKTVQ